MLLCTILHRTRQILSEEGYLSNVLCLSIGTAALLGLVQCKLDALPTTAYTMTYTESRCSANCAFCAQARKSSAKANRLSRITWPSFPLDKIINALIEQNSNQPFQRLCIQTLCYPNLFENLTQLVTLFRSHLPNIPLSIALPPIEAKQLQALYDQGVDRVAVSLDAITPTLFNEIKGAGVKGPFSWKHHLRALGIARLIFGPGRATTHLIIGLGETERQAVHLIQQLVNKSITVGLFPFTPIPGTSLANRERPTLQQYRRIQLAHHLLQNRLVTLDQIQYNSRQDITKFNVHREILVDIIARGKAFQTAGCPSCNRPFFTEQPGGPIYNYPEAPTAHVLEEITYQLAGVL